MKGALTVYVKLTAPCSGWRLLPHDGLLCVQLAAQGAYREVRRGRDAAGGVLRHQHLSIHWLLLSLLLLLHRPVCVAHSVRGWHKAGLLLLLLLLRPACLAHSMRCRQESWLLLLLLLLLLWPLLCRSILQGDLPVTYTHGWLSRL